MGNQIVIEKLVDGYVVSCPGGFDICADLDGVIHSVRQYCERWLETSSADEKEPEAEL